MLLNNQVYSFQALVGLLIGGFSESEISAVSTANANAVDVCPMIGPPVYYIGTSQQSPDVVN